MRACFSIAGKSRKKPVCQADTRSPVVKPGTTSTAVETGTVSVVGDVGTEGTGCGAVRDAAVRDGTCWDGAVREGEVCERPAESRDDDSDEARTNMGTLLGGTAPVGAVVWGHNRSRTCESDSDVGE